MQTAWLTVAIMGAEWVGAGVVAGIRSLAGGTLTVLGLILGIVGWCVITKGSKKEPRLNIKASCGGTCSTERGIVMFDDSVSLTEPSYSTTELRRRRCIFH